MNKLDPFAYTDADQSIRTVIDLRAIKTPEQPFLIDPVSDHIVTFAELREGCEALSVNLKRQGLKCGDPVAYALHNGVDTARVILGLMYGGFLATAVNLVAGKKIINHVLGHSDAKAVILSADTKPLIEDALALEAGTEPDLIMLDDALFSAGEQAEVLEKTTAETDGLLMYTSGTTGVPKGVVLTQSALLAGGSNTAIAHELSAKDRALCVLPLYHINGLCVTVIGPLVSSGAVAIPPKFSVSSFWGHMRRQQCTWFSVVPTQISYLLHEAETNGHDDTGLEQLRFGRSASAPLSPDVQRAFEERFQLPIIETMGLTETAAQILSNPMPPAPRKIGSPGIAFGNEVMIGDDKQIECPRGEEGEVLVRGSNVMRCYRNNGEATDAALTAEGWLRTGDLGRMDAEGYVFITGRLKELIIKGGENIAPREVDEALYGHPDVIEAAAFARPCKRYGQTIEAGVMVREQSTITASDLIALCVETIGSFKAPDHIHFLPELPKGPSGKIQRLKLAEVTENVGD